MLLLLDWDFRTTGKGDAVYEAKAAAAREFAETAGDDRRKLAKTTWAILTTKTPAELYIAFKKAVLAEVDDDSLRQGDRVNVLPVAAPYAGFTNDSIRAWLKQHLSE